MQSGEPEGKSIQDGVVTSTLFNREIRILSTTNEWMLATALLDTQCCEGNWISRRLVERLERSSSISTEFEPPEIIEASGRPVKHCGVVKLEWKWFPRGTRVHEDRFYVVPSSDHLDVVFGAEFIVSEKLLEVNEMAFLPLVRDKKSKKADKAAIEEREKKQQEEKMALEERQKQQQQGESQQEGWRSEK
ncbi:hypothetical protein NPX13_g10320 [Xylaria arbuscula]|uniref:Uncharacterized protein n=1 Tax=Xylaria arbuscula TaxID=114810 RepID=A0A9W8N5A0_9PEZI|nr:hypothetical protein NPX13_g10320 [Xylaria arbuscula]